MAKNTATGAKQERKITFKNKEHEKFYNTYLSKCPYQDSYHKTLIYCLGLSEDTRQNVNRIYDFEMGFIKPECLQEGWQTSGSERIVRLAFNLYTDGTPTTDEYDDTEEQITETRLYSVSDIFCTGDAKYFWEAIKIRYPDYCFYVDWEEMFSNKGTNQYFCSYAEVEKTEKKEEER